MLYYIIKPLIRIALYFFCNNILANTKKYKNVSGPLLLAANHPNSFFDAIIIGLQLNKPVYFLARGDAFHRPWMHKTLTALKCIPVYRLREGKQYLHKNHDSFERCKEIFRKDGIVLIFTEGLCENTWQIRPLKKGTARLAFNAWQDPAIGNKLTVLPVGVNYSSFRKIPKNVWVNFGEIIPCSDFNLSLSDGILNQQFNQKILTQWDSLVIDGVPITNRAHNLVEKILTHEPNLQFETINQLARFGNFSGNEVHGSESKKSCVSLTDWAKCFLYFMVSIPALLFCYLPYKGLKYMVTKIASNSVHYDSILFAVLTLFFLFYTLILTFLCYQLCNSFYLSIVFLNLLCTSVFVLTKCYILCIQITSLLKRKTYKK